MPEPALFDFTVPDELLSEVVARHREIETVADLELVPGTGKGKPPPFRQVMRQHGATPLALLTIAAFIPTVHGNAISLLAPDIEKALHLSDAGLGAVAFTGGAAQIAWALPVALAADRGSRRNLAALTLLAFAVFVSLMAISPNVWWFAFLFILAAVGLNTSDTVHNSYISDYYPAHSLSRVFSWHNLNDPLAQTVGILLVGYIATATGSWRWSLLVALAGVPVVFAILRQPEPPKGANESAHILRASGFDAEAELGTAPKVLLGSAVTRLLRIRSLYYQLVAVAILGFAGLGIPLFGSLYFRRVWHLSTAHRADVFSIIGLSAFLGLPVAYVVGDKLFRRAPQALLQLAAVSITVYGGLFTASLYMPHLWMVVALQFLGQSAVAPLSIAIFRTLVATSPAEMRSMCFAMFGVYGLVFGGFAGGVLLGAVSDATNVRTALTVIGPVCAAGGVLLAVGSRYVRRDITLVIEDVIERYMEGKRRQEGGAIPALQVHNLDFFYGAQQVLFDVNVEIAEGEIVALLGTNGAGKSTVLRAIAGLDHPHRGVVRLFGTTSTYLEAEQILDLGAALLVGGKMTFPGLSVRENLLIGRYTLRRDKAKSQDALDRALDLFPELADRLDQAAGVLSGGEQQMLALARVMMTTPRLLMIDELALGLAPMTVDRLMEMVRRVNADGATIILVEQSVNRAMSVAQRCLFLERGQIRFDGPTAELLERDDLLRPVFLAGTANRLGNGGVSFPPSVLLQGVVLGLNYGLLALGFTLIYRSNRILNFAQGQLGVVAAVFFVKLFYDYGFNYWFALLIALALAVAAGAGSELLLRRIFALPRVVVMVATIGLSQFLFVVAALPFVRPSKLFRAFPTPFHLSFTVGTYTFQSGDVLTLIVAPLVAIALAAFIKFSPWGLAMRAMAENSDSARLSGVWVRRTSTVAWGVAGGLSAITAMLYAPDQTSVLTQVLSPGLLLRALIAALIGAMVSLPAAFIAGIGVGVVEQLLNWNITTPGGSTNSAAVELILFTLLLVVLLVRVSRLRVGARGGERSTWSIGGSGRVAVDAVRERVRSAGSVGAAAVAALLPLALSVGHDYLMSQICIFAVMGLSLTVLTGWAGQISLGQVGLVAVGADLTAHLAGSVPLVLLLPLGGVVTAIVAVVVGLPALRVRGLYLAVTTLGFAFFMQSSVLATPCWTMPFVHHTFCTGLPNPQDTTVNRPTFLGLSLASERAFVWFCLGVLVAAIMMVRVWRDRGVARRLIAIRDNEVAAGAMGIPIVRTKLLAFALSGFLAGVAGVLLAIWPPYFSTDTFDPTQSYLVASIVVIGGLDAVAGSVLGALYIVGLPAVFGVTNTTSFLTSSFGVLVVILYLRGGLAVLVRGTGDLVAMGVRRLRAAGAGPSGADGTGTLGPGDGEPEVAAGNGRDLGAIAAPTTGTTT